MAVATSGTPTPSRRSARSRFMYSIVLAAKASSCTERPALASATAPATLVSSCAPPPPGTAPPVRRPPLGEDGALLVEQLGAVQPDRRALLQAGEHLAADVVQQRDAGGQQDL